MKRIALELLKISDSLDDLGLYRFSETTAKIADDLLSEADVSPAPAKQPQIQPEPIKQNPKEADKEFGKDKKENKTKKKPGIKGLVEGQDFVVNKKTEG